MISPYLLHFPLTCRNCGSSFIGMPKPRSHGIETKHREYSGEENCKGLLDWLNQSGNHVGQKRVCELLAAFVEHVSAVEMRWDPVEKRPIKLLTGNLYGRLDRLEKLCRRYTYYPLFIGLGSNKMGARDVQWFPASKSKKYSHGWAIEYDEMNAVLDLTRMAEVGMLRRLKRCDHCQRWIFARFAHQRFCSGGKCREKAFRSSPAEKEKRRRWARKYYWIQKHANVK